MSTTGWIADPGAMRTQRYQRALEQASADAFVLTSEAAVQHASGVRLYTQRLIPTRPIVCVVAPPGPPTLVCVDYERDQLAAEHPELDVVTFREFLDDPWILVADLLNRAGAERIVLEDTVPATWVTDLRSRFGGQVTFSSEAPIRPRVVKDPDEIRALEEGSLAAERAIAAGAGVLRPGRTENAVCGVIVASFVSQLGPRASEVVGICIGPRHITQMHHVGSPDPLPAHGPVRLGLVGRVDGYWVLLTRMLVMGDDPAFTAVYRRYADAYEDTMAALGPGAHPRELFARCEATLAAAGFTLTSSKIGHGTGLAFLERPVLSTDETEPLAPGMILAYDYGTAPVDGYGLHVEDRVLVTEDGMRRLSSLWDLGDPAGGHRGAVSAEPPGEAPVG